MIHNITEITTTKESYPFASAARYLDFDAYGYIEQEFYIEGTANVYESINDTKEVKVKIQDAPYVNRIIIRSPSNPAKASGRVVVEIINPTSFMEIDRMWILGYQKFMRDGDIYVGITSKPNTIASLIAFDEARYGCMSWKTPNKESFPFTKDDVVKKGLLPDLDEAYEPGLFWDMLTDLAWLLRKNTSDNPICEYPHQYVYLTGWSQSACYLVRYINSFAYRDDVKKDGQVFDGYLAGGGVRNLIIPVNQYETLNKYHFSLTRVEYVEQPLISIQTESENGQFDAFRTKRNDCDEPSFLYREYEISGASHDTMFSYVNYYQGDPDLKRIDHLPAYVGKHEEGNDYPSQLLFAAAFRNLFLWVEQGIGPNHCERILMDGSGHNRKDVFGNTMGGLRTCLLNVPTGRYNSTSNIEQGQSFLSPDATQDPLFGYQEAFSPSFLQELYGSLAHYEALCIKDTKEQVSKGFLCQEDAKALVEQAVALAKERGLK